MARHLHIALVLLAAGAAPGCWCAGSPGVLAGAGTDARFVSERSILVASTSRGLERMALDGSGARVLFTGHHSVLDTSPDFRTYLLSDSETNLLIGDATTGAMRSVPAVAKRVTAAALSPDGKRVAAVRHADFSLPQSSWTDDDSVFLIDVATLATTVIPPSTKHWPGSVEWSDDGSALWITMNHGNPPQWLTLADGKRHTGHASPPAALHGHTRVRSPKCPQTLVADKWSTELSIVDAPGAPPRVLVRLVGRKRGFHDYQADFFDPVLSPACKYVLFGHKRNIWVADAKTGALGPLVEGDLLFFEPPAAP
jgi:hypothetical protein